MSSASGASQSVGMSRPLPQPTVAKFEDYQPWSRTQAGKAKKGVCHFEEWQTGQKKRIKRNGLKVGVLGHAACKRSWSFYLPSSVTKIVSNFLSIQYSTFYICISISNPMNKMRCIFAVRRLSC